MKPKLKKEVVVVYSSKDLYSVTFYASPDAIEDFREFGVIEEQHTGTLRLYIDRRYDFEEVLKYMEDYNLT